MTADDMRISDWSSYVCSSDLAPPADRRRQGRADPRSRSEDGGAAVRPPDVGNGDRRGVLALDPIVARPAGADQPMGERGALGNAHADVPAHLRIPVAGDRKSTRLNSSH